MEKTLFVMFDFPPSVGGAQQFDWDMVRSLPRERCVIIAADFEGSRQFDLSSGYKTYRIPVGSMERLTIPLLPLVILYVISKERINYIWFSKYSRIITLVMWVARLKGSVRYGLTVFGEDLALVAEELGITCPRLAVRLRDTVLRKATHVVANSCFSASMLPTSTPTSVIYPCLPPDHIHPRVKDWRESTPDSNPGFTLLSVGKLTNKKGFDLVIRAVAAEKSTIPGLRYILAGAGPEEASLKALSKELEVDRIVQFAGRVSDKEKRKFYEASDVFVMPSRLEGFGIVFLEAAIHGLPSIGSHAGGIPEAIQDGRTGMLVKSGSVDDLRRAIATLAADRKLCSRLGRAAQQRCSQEFSWAQFAHHWANIFGA